MEIQSNNPIEINDVGVRIIKNINPFQKLIEHLISKRKKGENYILSYSS